MGEDYSEALFQSIDTIIAQRLKSLPYDRTITVTITDNTRAASDNMYRVSTDDFTQFYAYSEDMSYSIGDKVYVRIPAGDYTQQKIIVGKYIPEAILNFNNTENGFFYAASGTSLNNNPEADSNENRRHWLFNSGASSYSALGYSGFSVQFHGNPLANEENGLSKALTIQIKLYVNDSIYKESGAISATTIINNYDIRTEAYDSDQLTYSIPALSGINKIEVIVEGNRLDNINTITCTCILGYFISTKLSNRQTYLYIYAPDDAPTYYTYQGTQTTRNLNIRLLEAIIEQGKTPLLQLSNFKDRDVITIGIASDNLELEYNEILQGRYFSINDFQEYNSLENDNKVFGTIIKKTNEIELKNLPLISTSRNISIRAYYDNDGDTQQDFDALSEVYTFYAQTNTNRQGRTLQLKAEQNTFYIYNKSNQITPPGAAFKDYELTLIYKNKNDDSDTLKGSIVTISIPIESTMIASINVNGASLVEQNEEETSSLQSYKLDLTSNNNITNKLTMSFTIKDYYISTAHNNTIIAAIEKDSERYEATVELFFGSNASQGDDYILNMQLIDTSNPPKIISGLHPGENGRIKWELYNYQNVLINEGIILESLTPNSLYELKLYKNENADGTTSFTTSINPNNNTEPYIKGFLPIPGLYNNINTTPPIIVKYADAPTIIIYSITGKIPEYYKDNLQLFNSNNEIIEGLTWLIVDDPDNMNQTTDIDAPQVKSNKVYARTIYQKKNSNTQYYLIAKKDNILFYSCPLYIGQNKYYKPMIVQEENSTQQTSNINSAPIEDVAFGRVEEDGSRLYMGVNTSGKLELSASDDSGNSYFNLTSSSLTIGGKSVTTEGVWAGSITGNANTATTATTATNLAAAPILENTNTNKFKITIGDKSSEATIAFATAASQLTANDGNSNTPVYFTDGQPVAITSLNETLLGFNSNNSNFSSTGQDTKLYAWLKAIQTNMEILAAKHSNVTLTWPATL